MRVQEYPIDSSLFELSVQVLIVLLDTRVGEVRCRVKVWIHRALDARLDNEEVVRRNVERRLRIQPALLLSMEYPIEGIVGEQES